MPGKTLNEFSRSDPQPPPSYSEQIIKSLDAVGGGEICIGRFLFSIFHPTATFPPPNPFDTVWKNHLRVHNLESLAGGGVWLRWGLLEGGGGR